MQGESGGETTLQDFDLLDAATGDDGEMPAGVLDGLSSESFGSKLHRRGPEAMASNGGTASAGSEGLDQEKRRAHRLAAEVSRLRHELAVVKEERAADGDSAHRSGAAAGQKERSPGEVDDPPPDNWPYVRAIIVSFMKGTWQERAAAFRVLRVALHLTDPEASAVQSRLAEQNKGVGLLGGLFG